MDERQRQSTPSAAPDDPALLLVERLQRRWAHAEGNHAYLIQEELVQALALPVSVAVAAVVSLHAASADEGSAAGDDTRCLLRERGDDAPRPANGPVALDRLVARLGEVPDGIVELAADDPDLASWRTGQRSAVAGWLIVGVSGTGDLELLMIAGIDAVAAEKSRLRRTLVRLGAAASAARLGYQDLLALKRELATVRGENNALTTLNRTHGQFLAMASHEFKTPLTSITAYTDVLLDRLDDGAFPHTTEFLQVIRSEAERLARMTERLIDYSRLGYGRRLLDLQPVSVAPLVEQTVRALKHRVRRSQQKVTVNLPTDLPDIEADPDLVRQVVVNLLGNAVKYTPRGGSVTISAEEHTATVRIAIADDGPGIAPEELQRIFRQFYRAEGAADQAEGSGLGLAIVKHIVAMHGGHIDVQSHVGAGSTFSVLLPKVPVYARTATLLGESPAAADALGRVVRLGLRMVAELMGARVVVLNVLDPERRHLVVQGGLGLRDALPDDLVLPLNDATGRALLTSGDTVLVPDLASMLPGLAGLGMQAATRSGLAAPVTVGDEAVGLLVVGCPVLPETLAEDDATLLSILGQTIGFALATVTQPEVGHREVSRLTDAMQAVQLLRRSGVPTATPLALRMLAGTAKRLGLAAAEVMQLQYVGALHDVGMVRIDEEIVAKTGRLSLDERDLVDRHPEEAAELLAPLLPSPALREVVRLHHERMDGSGYPEGRRGEDIPLGARILLVVDAFFAMIAARPWRSALPMADVVREIQDHAGTQFDPAVVSAFVAVLHEEGILEAAPTAMRTRSLSLDFTGPAGTRS